MRNTQSPGRRWLSRAIPIGLTALFGIGATAGPATAATTSDTSAPIITSLLPPTGHQQVGTIRLHLVDPTRTDPSVPSHPIREIMVQIWYSATHTADHPTAPYLPPLAAAHFITANQLPANTVLPATIGHTGAPADHRHGPHPIVLYSTGGGADGALGTGLSEDLAAHGYTVVAIDDPYDSTEVEFPGGRLVEGIPGGPPLTDAQRVDLRAADASFVLNELTVLHDGGNPDAEHAPLPAGLGDSLDLSRVGMYGWSRGGTAAAVETVRDRRIRAAVSLEGTFYGSEQNTGTDRPFLEFTHSLSDNPADPLAAFLAASTGPKFHLNLNNTMHVSFSDGEELLADIEAALGQTPEQVAGFIGTLDPKTAVTDQRAYIRAFFDRFLRDHDNHLLDGPSPRFPDVRFAS